MIEGMTLFDYFVAHAPARPEPWFVPEMPPCPNPVGPNDVEDPLLRSEFSAYCNGHIDAEDLHVDLKPLAALRTQQVKEADAWRHRKEIEYYLQWPEAWARVRMDRRGYLGPAHYSSWGRSRLLGNITNRIAMEVKK